MKTQQQSKVKCKNQHAKTVFILVCLLFDITSSYAQAELEPLKVLFPSQIEEYQTYHEPERGKVKVNDKDYYNIGQRFDINIDTTFTVLVSDYRREPEFIERMMKEFENATPYEDESDKWSYIDLLGNPTQLQVIKKYPVYNFTTLVAEKSWIITFAGNGMDQEEATRYMRTFLNALLEK